MSEVADAGSMAGCLLAGLLLASPGTFADSSTRLLAENSLQGEANAPLEGGQCTAQILAPPLRREGRIEVTARPAMTRFDIVPARLEAATVQVKTRAEVATLAAMKPTFASETRRREVRPRQVRWVRDHAEGEIPLSAGERADIEASGISLTGIEPGQCVHEFHVPAVTAQRQHRVLIRESAEHYRITEPVLAQQMHELTLVPAYRRLIEVPPVIRNAQRRQRVRFDEHEASLPDGRPAVAYRSVSRPTVETPAMITSVLESAQTTEVPVWRVQAPALATPVTMPASFETITETYAEVEAWLTWRRHGNRPSDTQASGAQGSRLLASTHTGSDAVQALPESATPTGRVACLRLEPSIDHTYTFHRMTSPAQVRSQVEAAQFESFDVQEKRAPATAQPRKVPAQVSTRRVTVELQQTSPGSMPVVCAADLNRELVSRVQSALYRTGFDPGMIDGLVGPATLGALADYEAAMDLGVTGQFALPTLQRLGVRARLASSD